MNRIILTKTVKNNKTYTVYALMDENGNYKDFQLLPEDDFPGLTEEGIERSLAS